MKRAGILNRHLAGALAGLGPGWCGRGEARPYAKVLLRCGVFF
ncbi:hypothetical protein [Streptomyces sp. ML-6]|nr:hypothetical protein [Streptomyces sp. ML-6]MDK0523283.1 hypothetical protein [Streptomyces sp. ML-6]